MICRSPRQLRARENAALEVGERQEISKNSESESSHKCTSLWHTVGVCATHRSLLLPAPDVCFEPLRGKKSYFGRLSQPTG